MNHITTFPRWKHWDDEQVKAEYMRSQGLTAVDVGSRRALQKILIPIFKKKSPGYRLKKNQLIKIWQKQ